MFSKRHAMTLMQIGQAAAKGMPSLGTPLGMSLTRSIQSLATVEKTYLKSLAETEQLRLRFEESLKRTEAYKRELNEIRKMNHDSFLSKRYTAPETVGKDEEKEEQGHYSSRYSRGG